MTKEDLNQMYREYQAVLSMSEALKTAWMNIKLKAAMKERIALVSLNNCKKTR